MSEPFKESYWSLLQWLRSRILSSADVDEAILLASFYGEIKHANYDGIYFDDAIEDHVLGLMPPEFQTQASSASLDCGDVALLASDLLNYGGHTTIALKWLEARPASLTHKLIVTRTVTDRTREFVQSTGTDIFVCDDYSSAGVRTILRQCTSVKIVVLLVHPDDIVATCAARILQSAGRTVVFYNHADHCFSFGIHSSNIVAELGQFGQAISQRSGRARASCWLGIPVSVQALGDTRPRAQELGHEQIVMACGSAGKFRPLDGLFFGDFIDGILAAEPASKVVMIGPNGKEPWWHGCALRWGSRLEFMGHIPHSRYVTELQRATVFVDGFPMGGGTSFIEAVMLGKLCTGLALPLNSGYSHTDALRVATVPALVERVQHLLSGTPALLEHTRAVASLVFSTQGFSAFVERVENVYQGRYEKCTNPFPANAQEEGRWYERTWEAGGRFHIPSGGTLRKLPYLFRLRLLMKLLPRRKNTRLHDLLGVACAGMKRKALQVLSTARHRTAKAIG
jgi:hypothetical protein